MAQSMGVQGGPEERPRGRASRFGRGRGGHDGGSASPGAGHRAGNAPAARFAPNPVARVAPAPTYGDWVTSYGQSLASAKTSGRLVGASAPATTAPQTGGVNFTDKLRAGRA